MKFLKQADYIEHVIKIYQNQHADFLRYYLTKKSLKTE